MGFSERPHPVRSQLAEWWSSPAVFDERVRYFKERSLAVPLNAVVGLNLALYVTMALLMHLGTGPHSPAARAVVLVVCPVSTVLAVLWWRGHVSPFWSRFFLVYADIGIAVMAWQAPTAIAGLFLLSFLILMAFYAVYWDSPRVVALHSGWMLITVGAFGAQRFAAGELEPAVLGMMLAAGIGFVATPPAFHFGMWMLMNAAAESFSDPLTGVLNRRGLHAGAEALWQESAARGIDVVVIVVDLDEFKAVNDTWGHSVGDEVLIRSAARVKAAVSDRALVARIGGEELAVVDMAPPDLASSLGSRVQQSINNTSDRVVVTASVGVVCATRQSVAGSRSNPLGHLDSLIDLADQAMLSAKRTGRNRTVLVQLDDRAEAG